MATYTINKNLIIQKLDDKTVMFDSDASILYTLNETADYIFTLLKKKMPKSEIVKKVVKRYGAKEEAVSKDVDEIVESLIKKKVLLLSSKKK